MYFYVSIAFLPLRSRQQFQAPSSIQRWIFLLRVLSQMPLGLYRQLLIQVRVLQWVPQPASSMVSDLDMPDASASIMGSGSVLPIKYALCSLPTTTPTVFRPSYAQVIQINHSLSLTRDSGRDPSFHVVKSSKSLIDDDLEVYNAEGEEKDGDGDEIEFVAESASLDVMTSVA